MRFDVITIFPEIFDAVSIHGITSRAIARGLWQLHLWNPREVTEDLHRSIDERPFGGGPGMVMLADPLYKTLELIRHSGNNGPVVAFSPTGDVLNDSRVREWNSAYDSMVLVCGRYEGIDQRFLDTCVDYHVSLGDFVLSGAEIPACALIDALVRQLPGCIKELSVEDESFGTGLLDAPHYTRPEIWHEIPVPEVLLSGHHANIARFTREKSLELTYQKRPDLIRIARSRGLLSPQDEVYLKTLDTPQ